jgi:hypothetical protein
MPDDSLDLKEKALRANKRIAQHERRTTIALTLLILLNLVLLGLVMSHLLEHSLAWDDQQP